jgi:hypothetical protein
MANPLMGGIEGGLLKVFNFQIAMTMPYKKSIKSS